MKTIAEAQSELSELQISICKMLVEYEQKFNVKVSSVHLISIDSNVIAGHQKLVRTKINIVL